jgi:hypothetical protein
MQALDVRRGHPHATLVGVPRHLVGAVAQDRGVDLAVEVELRQVVRLGDVAQGTLRHARPVCRGGRPVFGVNDALQAVHQV